MTDTPLTEGMIAIHEVFQSLLAGGFTEHQACVIVGTLLAVGGSGSQRQEGAGG